MAPVVDGLDYPGRVEIPESDIRPNPLIYWPGVQASRRIFLQSSVGLFDWKGTGGNWNRGTCTVYLPLYGLMLGARISLHVDDTRSSAPRVDDEQPSRCCSSLRIATLQILEYRPSATTHDLRIVCRVKTARPHAERSQSDRC